MILTKRGFKEMKKLILLVCTLIFGVDSIITQAQDLQIPAGAVVRQANCVITDERLTFQDILDRARELQFSENAPDAMFFRRPVYASPDYDQNYDFMIAQYYPSYSEMAARRIPQGNSAYGRLAISCDTASVVRNIPVSAGDGLEDFSLMTTRFCTLNPGATARAAFSRAREAMLNIERDSGNDTMMQMWLPGLGGQMNTDFDFVAAHIGSNPQELMERLDLFRDGYRAGAGNNREATHSCARPSLWATYRVFQAAN